MDVGQQLLNHGISAANVRRFVAEPDPVYLFDVPGRTALEAWSSLHAAAPDDGYSPVILGAADGVGPMTDGVRRTPEPPADTVCRASAINVLDWLARRRDADPDLFDPDHGPWPAPPQPPHALAAHLNGRGRVPFSRVAMALAPTPHSWQTPAFLRFGMLNDGIRVAEHVAVWKRWHAAYGAEIVSLVHDVIEARVARPPTTRAAAMALAVEQFTYCYDVVIQGTQTIEVLASSLLNGSAWFFWWD